MYAKEDNNTPLSNTQGIRVKMEDKKKNEDTQLKPRKLQLKMVDNPNKATTYSNVFYVTWMNDYFLLDFSFIHTGLVNADEVQTVAAQNEVLIPMTHIKDFLKPLCTTLISAGKLTKEMTVDDIIHDRTPSDKKV